MYLSSLQLLANQAEQIKVVESSLFCARGIQNAYCVYANGMGSGKNSHISVSLLLLFDDELE